MSVYVASVLLGLLLLLLLGIYVLIVMFVAKKAPGAYLRAIREPQLLAFSTLSSAAVMPKSMQTAYEKQGCANPLRSSLFPWVRRLTWTVRRYIKW